MALGDSFVIGRYDIPIKGRSNVATLPRENDE